MGPKEILGCSFMPQRSEIGQEMAKLQLFSYWEVGWFYWEPHGTKGDPRVFMFTKKISNRSRNGWVIAFFPLRGCVISLRTTRDQRGSLDVHLCQKDPKSVKNWLSYGYFPTGRLRDFIENHMGPKGNPWVFICAKKIQNRSRNGWVTAIFPLWGCVISLRTTWVQKGYLGVHLCQKDPKLVKKWLSYSYFPLKGCVISLRATWVQRGYFGVHLFQKDLKTVKKWPRYSYFH